MFGDEVLELAGIIILPEPITDLPDLVILLIDFLRIDIGASTSNSSLRVVEFIEDALIFSVDLLLLALLDGVGKRCLREGRSFGSTGNGDMGAGKFLHKS